MQPTRQRARIGGNGQRSTLTLPATPGALKVTEDQRDDLETVGPWHIPVRFKAPAIAIEWGDYSIAKTYTLYGPRTLSGLKEGGLST